MMLTRQRAMTAGILSAAIDSYPYPIKVNPDDIHICGQLQQLSLMEWDKFIGGYRMTRRGYCIMREEGRKGGFTAYLERLGL